MFGVDGRKAGIRLIRYGLRFIPVPLIAAAFLDLFAGPPTIAGLRLREFWEDLLDEAVASG